ncbi:MAG: pyruvate kinase [Candidatus Promineifilaceae bacterium]
MPHMKLPNKKTKIVCTIGPASQSPAVLEQMMAKGMNVARINFAHGNFETHRQNIANIRTAARQADKLITIMGDLPGPKMRIGELAQEPIELERGQPFILQSAEILGNSERVSMDFAGLSQAVKPGDHIYMNDGYIQLRVDRVIDQEVHCTVQVGGELRSRKGVNFPGIDLGISAFTADDQELLAFAAEQELEAISQSFVRTGRDIEDVRAAADALDYKPFIIAKIERSGALDDIEAVLQAADGIMVARGDLGVEIPIEKIPSTQKELIQRANLVGKPVITATQMLESMTSNRRPTRAEVTDVANAILDGSDAVMLSGETAIGSYPVETVAMMARIAQDAEETHSGRFGVGPLLEEGGAKHEMAMDDLISCNIYGLAKTLDPTLLFVPSLSGATAQRVARFRLPQWIIAPSRDETTCQRLQFSFGVYPVYVPAEAVLASPEERQAYTRQWLKQYGVKGDLVLLIEGSGTLKVQDTKRIDIIDVE